MLALGLVETRGLLAAIECADAMLKAADVKFLERHFVGAGLVTVTVTGEVAAVRAAVDAGTAAVRAIRDDALLSAHVIARPDVELGRIAALVPASENASGTGAEAGCGQEDVSPSPSAAAPDSGEAVPVEPRGVDISRLKKMSLARLRDLARGTDGLGMTREALETARKNELIEALVRAYRQEEE